MLLADLAAAKAEQAEKDTINTEENETQRENLSNKQRTSKKGTNMVHELDYSAGEKADCTSKLTIADRIFYTKLYSATPARFFSGDQKGIIQKEISKAEFELWVNILADSEAEVAEIRKKLAEGKKY